MNDKVNNNLYEANIKLVDKNKYLEEEVKYLRSKVENVTNLLKESLKVEEDKLLREYIKSAIENLGETEQWII